MLPSPMPHTTLAAEGGVDPTLAGAAVACAVAGIGYLGTRKSRSESTKVLIDAATALANAATESETRARQELRELRDEFEDYRTRTDEALERCRKREGRMLEVARQLGITFDDV